MLYVLLHLPALLLWRGQCDVYVWILDVLILYSNLSCFFVCYRKLHCVRHCCVYELFNNSSSVEVCNYVCMSLLMYTCHKICVIPAYYEQQTSSAAVGERPRHGQTDTAWRHRPHWQKPGDVQLVWFTISNTQYRQQITVPASALSLWQETGEPASR